MAGRFFVATYANILAPNANPFAPTLYRAALALCLPAALLAQAPSEPGDSLPIPVPDAAGPITLDGRLDEPAWAHAARLTTFYETWPGDNIAPPVRTTVALSYDARALYVGIWAQDPDPARVRAAYADRDNVGPGDDYVALVLDTRGDGRVGAIFRISPRGVQADGVFNEAQFALGNNPDDLTPDFAWDARTAIGDSAWTAELRIPFTALRYPGRERQTWGVIVHRVYPRDLTHSLSSVRMPRGTTCFLCHAQRVELTGLPTGGALLAAPYATAQADRAGAAGGPGALRAGADLKWTPGAGTALDATVRPDFSQIESDVAQLAVNAQFALFYPERRRFFLEGSDLFQTPLQVVYTRSIAAPDWGARATGELGRTAYTLLVVRDHAGGSAILPGPTQSSLVTKDFASSAGVARLRTAFSGGSAGLLATDREVARSGGGGHNRLVGGDFFWSLTGTDQLTGQLLASDTRLPQRPDLTAAWDGRGLTSAALDVAWHHLARHAEWFADYRDVGAGFRADDGFMPQVGTRQVNLWADAILYRSGAIFWVSPWVKWQRVTDRVTGNVVSAYRAAALQLSGLRDLYVQVRLVHERLRALDSLLARRYGWMYLEVAPGRRLARVQLLARLGGDVDVANARRGRGAELSSTLVLHASDHLALEGVSDFTWLDVPAGGVARPLFRAGVERLRATYNFTPRVAVRLVVQNVRIRRDPALYVAPTSAVEGSRTLAALFTYRWSWASAAYLGLGDDRAVDSGGTFAPGHQQLFVKIQAATP